MGPTGPYALGSEGKGMTSEVLLMNRSAVAMAADSAVTIMGQHGHTIYQSVDKVFQLVEDQPVGVMIYNNAEIMGTPWETVIMLYRKQARGKAFDTVEDYAKDFVKFIDGNVDLFPPDAQRLEFIRMVAFLFGAIVREYDAELRYAGQVGAGAPNSQASEVFAGVVREVHALYQAHFDGEPRGNLDCYPADLGDRLKRKYKPEIDQVIDSLEAYVAESTPGFRLEDATRDLLRDMSGFVVIKDAYFEGYTGIVFAGFGRKEQFPAMVSYFTSGVLENVLKRSVDRRRKINADSGPAILPFAQDRMVHTLVRGIDPDLRYQIFSETLRLANFLVQDVVRAVPGMTEASRQSFIKKYSQENLAAALGAFFERIDLYQRRAHTEPILRAIDNLPRMELAETAASLVKLNSFQLRVTGQPETVGGPIDVAIISLADGLVMIQDSHTYA
jgi:hypothetical protein